jgi:3-isopropylmalate/(R)-2-methylmalate dehydratase small subunit
VNPNTEIIVSLPDQKVTIPKLNISESFEINTYKKENMLNGYDDIDYLMNIKESIKKFSKTTPL